MHSEGILAGELKHGPLALVIDDAMPVIMVVTKDPVYTEVHECFATVPHTVDCLQGILTVIPMQLLSFHIAVLRECNVDCPRNLAQVGDCQ
ncbi:glutamine--fructose-6-phosphate aminotransferase 2 [Caerostris extrusa]|uniref:Glutamine--fructose-6-phosphate aminotransferase 2 n=1 Tax=Caerostris extrusa TaxID=172846 RepID=A0AAV4X607_CAEEX|nr:glutamine--fructose-6-phosphate aminotransferase 2 [Caerostris extrusa]